MCWRSPISFPAKKRRWMLMGTTEANEWGKETTYDKWTTPETLLKPTQNKKPNYIHFSSFVSLQALAHPRAFENFRNQLIVPHQLPNLGGESIQASGKNQADDSERCPKLTANSIGSGARLLSLHSGSVTCYVCDLESVTSCHDWISSSVKLSLSVIHVIALLGALADL